MTLPIETLNPPPPPAMGPAEAKALLPYLRAATEAHDPAVSEGDRVLLCSAVAWIRRLAETAPEPVQHWPWCARTDEHDRSGCMGAERLAGKGPLDGWTFKPWDDRCLWAKDEIEKEHKAGAAADSGRWLAWMPGDMWPFAEGREPGNTPEERLTAARQACENALRARGAKL